MRPKRSLDKVSETEHLRIRFATERVARLNAQAGNVRRDLEQAELARIEVLETLSKKYKLLPGDRIGDDGTIQRSPRPTKPETD